MSTERDAAAHTADAGAALQEQLDLFPPTKPPADRPPGISPGEARAAVSPGWWPLVAPLFGYDDFVVWECREADGRLDLRASPSRDYANGDWVEPLLQRIAEAASRTCGCCGGSPADPLLLRLDGVVRVVCVTCRARLKAGDAYLTIADEYWRFDGTRRERSRAVTGVAAHAPDLGVGARSYAALDPAELRKTIADITSAMQAEIVGQDDAVRRLALLAGLHVGGGLARGGRVLIVGPSGVGKSSLMLALRRALEAGRWDVPFLASDALDLTSPGWGGAPSIGDLLHTELGDADPNSPRARHAVVVIDEIHHAGVVAGLQGNMLAKRQEVLGSLLSLVGHGTLRLGEGGREWSSRDALVIALGAFTGLLDLRSTPTPTDLVVAGIPLELATRFEEVIILQPLGEQDLIEMLRRWPALVSLTAVCERLGYLVRIHNESFVRAARAVTLADDGATPRTAGGWLVAALRSVLIAALDNEAVRELEVTPDSLTIARMRARERPPDDPPDSAAGWDATIILTPR